MHTKILAIAIGWHAQCPASAISKPMGNDTMDGIHHDFTTFEKANQPTKIDEIPVGKHRP